MKRNQLPDQLNDNNKTHLVAVVFVRRVALARPGAQKTCSKSMSLVRRVALARPEAKIQFVFVDALCAPGRASAPRRASDNTMPGQPYAQRPQTLIIPLGQKRRLHENNFLGEGQKVSEECAHPQKIITL